MCNTLGNSLVDELAQRGQRGMYFDYEGYNVLRSLSTVGQVQEFLDSKGFASVLAKDDPSWIADGLAEAAEDKTPPWWISADFLSVFFLPFWLLTRLRPKRRVFPRRSSSEGS